MCFVTPLWAAIQLPVFFSNGMVLQRGDGTPVWGQAAPGETIQVEINGFTASATADTQGQWTALLNGLTAGGPYTLTIKTAGDSLSLSDVWIGDVWLCSGQSNMAFLLHDMGDLSKEDIASAHDPQMRYFTARTYITPNPYENQKWTETNPQTAGGQSAVAFYFGRELRDKLHIPIGLLNISFPGSAIEGWMSTGSYNALGMTAEMKALQDAWDILDTATPKFLQDLERWETQFNRQDTGNKGFAAGWASSSTDLSAWKKIANLGDWTSLGLKDGGALWIRKTVDLPAEVKDKDLILNIGLLRNDGKEFGNVLGTVYFNNQEIGTIGHILKHIYSAPDESNVQIPGSLVTSGENVIAIRFFTQKQTAPWRKTNLQLRPAEKTKLPLPVLTPECMARVESELPPQPAEALASRPVPPPAPPQVRLPSFFFNSMLKPAIGYGIKGVIWYQGEANTENFAGEVPSVLGKNPAFTYRQILPAMIQEWRQLWKRDNLPFYIVQLPNTNLSTSKNDQPGKSSWAVLRESQIIATRSTTHASLIVTIDTGSGDIHPTNKKPVGQRLANAALAQTYEETREWSGPMYESMTIEANKIRIKFNHAGKQLVAHNGPLKEFSIAGTDRKFVWAEAIPEGDTVVVSSKEISAPVAVRYGWADNPSRCNLFNSDNLPASPFRTDDWPVDN